MSEEMRIFLGILCLGVSVCLIVLGGRCLWAQIIFSKYPKRTKTIGAVLREAEQKNGVRIRTRRLRSVYVKHLTHAVYVYTVEGVAYFIREPFFGTKRQTPRFVPVVYITASPRFAYVDELASFSDIRYGLKGAILLLWSLICIFLGLALWGIVA